MESDSNRREADGRRQASGGGKARIKVQRVRRAVFKLIRRFFSGKETRCRQKSVELRATSLGAGKKTVVEHNGCYLPVVDTPLACPYGWPPASITFFRFASGFGLRHRAGRVRRGGERRGGGPHAGTRRRARHAG